MSERPTLAGILPRGKNGFDLVRLVAALMVIYGHAFTLFPTAGARDLFVLATGHDAGELGVIVFFFLSGILVSASFTRSATWVRFALLRIARIWPGVLVAMLLATVALGPAVTTLSTADYWASPWTPLYLGNNWILQTINDGLPGVFVDNHYRASVNGSLWTLITEVKCYAVLFVVGITGALCRARWTLLACAGLLAWYWLAPESMPFFGEYPRHARNAGFFMIGTAAFSVRDYLRIDGRALAAAIVVCALGFGTLFGEWVFGFTFCYAVLWVSAQPAAARVHLPGDYSYGVYLYAFMVQQTLNHFAPEVTSYQSMVVVVPITVAFAVLSWHLVEKPAMAAGKAIADAVERAAMRYRFVGLLRAPGAPEMASIRA